MFYSMIGAVSGVFWALWYSQRLSLTPREALRLMRKSGNLGLCYGAFALPVGTAGAAARAGLAAFCCAAYDVVTDWRGFDPLSRTRYFDILRQRVPIWAVHLTESLYAKELVGTVAMDGLERGVVAVEFVTGVIGSRSHYEKWGLERLGILCQIIDDILDELHDRLHNEQNCLQSERGSRYLYEYLSALPELFTLFKGSPAMTLILEKARRRSGELLALSR